MSNARNKKKLTENQLDKRIILITGIVCVLFFALCMRLCPYANALTIFATFAFTFLLGNFTYVELYSLIVLPKLNKEKMLDVIKKNLSKNSFTEIYYKLQNSNDDIIVDILKKEQYKFYAKLDEDQDDNIIIIAKNKSEEEVFRTVTRNPKYFLLHFSLTEN